MSAKLTDPVLAGCGGEGALPSSPGRGETLEINVDIAAVFLGSGIRLFDHLAGTPIVLGNPTVIPGIGVTHLRYPVRTT